MQLQILSFTGKSYSQDQVISVTLMTGVGEITILDNHAPLITSMKPSTMYLVYRDANNMEIREDFAIGKGVVEVSHNEVKIMADMLKHLDDIDVQMAQHARLQALEQMEKYKHAKDRVDMEKFIEAEDMLLKSIAQLKLRKEL